MTPHSIHPRNESIPDPPGPRLPLPLEPHSQRPLLVSDSPYSTYRAQDSANERHRAHRNANPLTYTPRRDPARPRAQVYLVHERIELEHGETRRTQRKSCVPRMPDERIWSGRDKRVGMSACVCVASCAAWYGCARARTLIGAGVELAEGAVGGISQKCARECDRRSCDDRERQGRG
jgi:hypothetical protein